MKVVAACPTCGDSLVFHARNHERGAPLVAACAACATSYRLWGGHVTPVDDGNAYDLDDRVAKHVDDLIDHFLGGANTGKRQRTA